MNVSPFPTDPIKSARLGKFLLISTGKKIPEFFSVPFRKREKIIYSILIRNTSRITYGFIEDHWGKSISKSNNNDGHHMVCQCRCSRKPERLKKLIRNALKKIRSKNTWEDFLEELLDDVEAQAHVKYKKQPHTLHHNTRYPT